MGIQVYLVKSYSLAQEHCSEKVNYRANECLLTMRLEQMDSRRVALSSGPCLESKE